MARRKKQNEDQSAEDNDNLNNESDDSFGLPEVEYEPLKRDEPQSSTTEESSYQESSEQTSEETVQEEEVIEEPQYRPVYDEEEEKPSVWPKVIVILLLLGIAGAGVWYFGFERPKQQQAAEDARKEELRKQEMAKAEEERKAELRRQEAEQRRADSLANLAPKEGSIEKLTDRTRRYYVVVSSAIDDDLIMDYAKKLSKNGVNCTIIPPFGKTKFSRLAVDVKDSFADAQTAADALKGGDFGSEIWVVKY